MFSCEFCKISKNIFFYRTPLAATYEGLVWDINVKEEWQQRENSFDVTFEEHIFEILINFFMAKVPII